MALGKPAISAYMSIARSYSTSFGEVIEPTNIFDFSSAIMSLLSDVQEETSLGNVTRANDMINAAKVMLSNMKSAARNR